MKKIIVIALFLLIPGLCQAEMPDIVQSINLALTNFSAEQKVKLLEDYCFGRGYKEQIIDETTGETIPNPVSKKAFMNYDISINIIKRIIDNYRKQEAMKAAGYEALEIDP